MCQEVPFNVIMQNHNNWSENANYDIMTQNYHKLKPIMNKMFFYGYPEHPDYFSLLFSEPRFADDLIEVIIQYNIKNLERVYFEEFSKEDRIELISKGFIALLHRKKNEVSVIYMCQDNSIFVNLVL